jgi:cytochrome c peroxidase
MNRVLLIAAALILPALPTAADEALRADALALFGRLEAVPASKIQHPEVELGRAIFWDQRLSADGITSCGSCHFARDWGADRNRVQIDARGLPTSRHTMTVFNAMSQPTLRWLGDRKDGADQAESSMTGSMGFPSKQAGVAALAQHQYAEKFRAAYPDESEPMSARNYGKALAAYQATLVTPAPFDRFLAGDDSALDATQKAGLRSFIETGCATCHSGPLLGGTMFQPFGIQKDYWLVTKSTPADPGRFAITKKAEDKNVFRVPMLRNVAKTAPYFHDGSVSELGDAVRIMADLQLGRALDDAETDAIVRFLDSLTGEVPAHYAPPGKTPKLD